MSQDLSGRTLLITGANGGLGVEFVRQGLERGAARVYAAARRPQEWHDERVVPLVLDLDDADSVAQAARRAGDVDLLVNNAAIAPWEDRSVIGDEDLTRRILETNLFGTLRVAKAFAPVLAGHGGGAMLNILSAAAWTPMSTAYAVSKAAAWSATNGLRVELRAQGTSVTGLLVGMIDTKMAPPVDVPRSDPADVVAQAYDGVLAGDFEVYADDDTRWLKSQLTGSPEELDRAVADRVAAVHAS